MSKENNSDKINQKVEKTLESLKDSSAKLSESVSDTTEKVSEKLSEGFDKTTEKIQKFGLKNGLNFQEMVNHAFYFKESAKRGEYITYILLLEGIGLLLLLFNMNTFGMSSGSFFTGLFYLFFMLCSLFLGTAVTSRRIMDLFRTPNNIGNELTGKKLLDENVLFLPVISLFLFFFPFIRYLVMIAGFALPSGFFNKKTK